MTTLDALVATCARHLRRAGAAKRLEASPRAVEEIARAVCAVSMDDVGLRALRAFSRRAEARDARDARERDGEASTTSTPRATSTPQATVMYLRLHAEEDFTVGAFVFERGQTIPLHNHPEMTVLMRCLFGETRVKAYDLIDDAPRLSTRDAHAARGGGTRSARVRRRGDVGGERRARGDENFVSEEGERAHAVGAVGVRGARGANAAVQSGTGTGLSLFRVGARRRENGAEFDSAGNRAASRLRLWDVSRR